MGRIRKAAARKAALPKIDQKTLEERQRIAEQLVRELRKAGYVCSPGDNSLVPTLRRDN
jgi:hypothetical protein